ncbi:Cas9 inhibitor AcrIIA9 family protein [Clostridium tagluense]|uniref:Uncharacterized protein n=1 Tax=Clostridium tagluense TaxID=360422 RepID=A0A401UUF4_9CLOT|nr:Cas9 inhibitor AcrIIA9 family protein [Clostridium tagluense]GCD13177.1 hypothetical protein Ctaglu_48000 [Clostridium tagluense]
MLNKAIEKLKAEIDGNKNNPYIHVVGEFLLQHLQDNPSNAEKVVQVGKTIGQSLNEMKKAAEKKKVGNCAVLTDQEGFKVVLEYFGIDAAVSTVGVKPQEHIVQAPIAQDKKTNIEFNVELDF